MPFTLPYPAFTPGTDIDANQVNANDTALLNACNSLLGSIPPAVPGIFVSTMTPNNAGAAAANTTALQADMNALIGLGGGTYILPEGKCYVSGQVYIGSPLSSSGIYAPIRIMGASNQSVIIQTTNNDVFQVNTTTSGGTDACGVDFLNFEINFIGGLTSGAGIRTVSGQSINIDRIFFNDCPQAIAADNAAQMFIFRCLGSYANNTSPANLAMVTIGTATGVGEAAVEVHMDDCTWRSTPINAGGVGGFGISMFDVEHVQLKDVRVEGFQQGVSVIPVTGGSGKQATRCHFDKVFVFTDSNTTGTGAAFYFKPQNGQTIQQITMIDCEAHPGDVSGTSYTGPGIVFDASAGSSALIDQVRLVSCYSANWNGPGMRVIGTTGTASNFHVIGGAFICNGQTQTGANGAGIYVSGVVGCYVTGAQLDNYSSQYSATQTYGFANDSSSSDTWVRGCAMAGNVTGPVYANGTFVHFCVLECRGYNNLNTQVAGLAQIPATTTQFDGTTVGVTPYYGPILVVWSGGTVSGSKISHDRGTISAVAIGQTTGCLPLQVGQSMEIDYSVTPTAFTVWGQ